MIRHITVPETITAPVVKAEDGKRAIVDGPFAFEAFIGLLLSDEHWKSSTKALRLSICVQDAFKDAAPGAVVDISEEAYEGLCASLKPKLFLLADTARACMRGGYWAAIEEAPQKSDTVKDEGAKDAAE